MSMYRTLKKHSTSLYKEKGSKFYGYAFPIENKEDVKVFLDQVKEYHTKARHFCYAFLLGEGDAEYYLANDDGEPSNSAGAPILGQIRSYDIINSFIVVVRYFGGTKLGVGGLIQAYKQAAMEAIEDNIIIALEPQSSFNFKIGFDQMGAILSIIDKNKLNAKIDHLSTAVEITIKSDTKDEERIKALFNRFELQF